MIDTGAHLRVGGVIHVQKRGTPGRTLLSIPHTSEHYDQTVIPGPNERELAEVSQPEDEEGSEAGGVGSGCIGRADLGEGKRGGETAVDGKQLKISVAKSTGVHSEEALAERMEHLRSQR